MEPIVRLGLLVLLRVCLFRCLFFVEPIVRLGLLAEGLKLAAEFMTSLSLSCQNHPQITTHPTKGDHRGIGREIELPYRALFDTFLILILFGRIYVVVNLGY